MTRLAALCLSLLCVPSFAGVTVTMESQAKKKSRLLIDGAHLRIDSAASDGVERTVLIDAATRKLQMLDHTAKNYRELDLAMLGGGAGPDPRQAQMEAMLAKLPPEKRAMMEAAMKQPGMPAAAGAPPAHSYEPTGEKKTVAGFACEGYREKQGDRLVAESCLIPWEKTGLTKADLEGFKQLRDALPSTATDENPLKSPGLPAVRTRIKPDGTKGDTDTLTSLKKGAVAAAEFAIPAGFTKLELGSRPAD